MSADKPRPIIVRKKKVIAGGRHHGGAWKVAYADFVTAMMAFFLLMWLLNATSEDQRKGLADYFNPTLPVSRTSAGGAGLLKGESIFSEETASGNQRQGEPPRPTHRTPGKPLDGDPASPDAPPGENAAHAGAGDSPENPEDAAASEPNPDMSARLAAEQAE